MKNHKSDHGNELVAVGLAFVLVAVMAIAGYCGKAHGAVPTPRTVCCDPIDDGTPSAGLRFYVGQPGATWTLVADVPLTWPTTCATFDDVQGLPLVFYVCTDYNDTGESPTEHGDTAPDIIIP